MLLKKNKRKKFSLIELLIVIGLLGGLASLVLTNLSVEKEWADNSIIEKEMRDVRDAFARFVADCGPRKNATSDQSSTGSDMEQIMAGGLEVLMDYNYNGKGRVWSFKNWDDDSEECVARARGWRGPYLQGENTRQIAPDSSGQSTESGTDKIPVIEDPRAGNDNLDDDEIEEHFYRVVYDSSEDILWLVCILDTDSGLNSAGEPDLSAGNEAIIKCRLDF